MAHPLLKTDKNVRINHYEIHKLGFDDYGMYRDFHTRATPADLTYYSSFPILMRGSHAWQVIDGFLFLFRINRNGNRRFVDVLNLPRNAVGEFLDVASTKKILDRINGSNAGGILHVHPALADRYGARTVRPERTSVGREYVYDNHRLSMLEGGEFRNLRKNANKFGNRVNFEIVPYERRMREHANQIYQHWCVTHGLKYDGIWDMEMYGNLLGCYGEIDHSLFMVADKDRNEYIGFFDAVTVNETLAIGVFRKLSEQYKGIAEYCQVYLAKHLAARGITYINDGDDCYEWGLRVLKEKFHPVTTFIPVEYEF
jgi:hypothetical protein